MTRWTAADVRQHRARQMANAPTRAKYGNTKVEVDGYVFDSKKEAAHFQTLKMRLRAGQIDALEVHPQFEIYLDLPAPRGRVHIAWYSADFRWWTQGPHGAELHVEDVKSTATKTEAYRLRKKLVEAIYQIEITEI